MCSLFAIKTIDDIIVARNHDWIQFGGTIHIVPPGRSYGTPTRGISIVEQIGPDRPFEGVNDFGLYIGIAAARNPGWKGPFTEPACRMSDFGIVRWVLERASTVAEALGWFRRCSLDYHLYDPQHLLTSHIHYLIVDASGTAALYEEGDKPRVRDLTAGGWEGMTNDSTFRPFTCDRYEKLVQRLREPVADTGVAMRVLAEVANPLTAWSSVYHLRRKTIDLCVERSFDQVHHFDLQQLLARGGDQIDFSRLKLLHPQWFAKYQETMAAG